MKQKENLYKLLYSAFVQMRAEAYEKNDKKAFRICDLLHKVPLELLSSSNEKDYDEILNRLNSYVDSTGMRKWFDSEISEIERTRKASG